MGFNSCNSIYYGGFDSIILLKAAIVLQLFNTLLEKYLEMFCYLNVDKRELKGLMTAPDYSFGQAFPCNYIDS